MTTKPPDPRYDELLDVQQRVAVLVDQLGIAVSELRATIDHIKDEEKETR